MTTTKNRRRLIAGLTLPLLATALGAAPASAHPQQHGTTAGHLPAVDRNVDVIGKLQIAGVAPGQIADVAAHRDHAYLASWREPDCTRGGIYVVDIRDAAAPRQVAFVPSAPGNYPGEGMQVLSLKTSAFRGDVLIHNNETCPDATTGVGGIRVLDVTRPASPTVLVDGAGDRVGPTGAALPKANDTHSAFGWVAGDRAFVALVDNVEATDLDVLEITDPRNPRLLAEYELDRFGGTDITQPELGGGSVFLHDLVVERIDGRYVMLASYWDGGYVQLDVTDPARATLINETDFTVPDPERAARGANVLPEGNAHQAEFTRDNRYFVGTDEDFSPFKLESRTADGQSFRSQPGADARQIAGGQTLTGPTRYVGQACTAASVPAPGSAGEIAVVERGGCTFQAKADSVKAAGYTTGIVFNSVAGGENLVNMAVATDIVFVFVPRSAGLRILDQPAGGAAPAVGTTGQVVTFRSFFDGWGYVHLYDRATARELDTYAIPESQDARFAEGFGDLSVHEVATDPKKDLAYLSYYAGGFRVVSTAGGRLQEVGAFIDQGGNNFWGVEIAKVRKYGQVVLASDRDYGLYVFQYDPKNKADKAGKGRAHGLSTRSAGGGQASPAR